MWIKNNNYLNDVWKKIMQLKAGANFLLLLLLLLQNLKGMPKMLSWKE